MIRYRELFPTEWIEQGRDNDDDDALPTIRRKHDTTIRRLQISTEKCFGKFFEQLKLALNVYAPTSNTLSANRSRNHLLKVGKDP